MILSDLIYNQQFDVNCNYIVYHTDDRHNVICDTQHDGYPKLKDAILDKQITYITVVNNKLLIEIEGDTE